METKIRINPRTNNWKISAKISEATKEWFEVKVPDISAGGLMFRTERTYQDGDALHFDLLVDPVMHDIYGKIKEMHIKAKAVIVSHRNSKNNTNSFGVKFTEMAAGDRVRLDELIRLTIMKYGNDSSHRDRGR